MNEIMEIKVPELEELEETFANNIAVCGDPAGHWL
jgi:hypothetical protein